MSARARGLIAMLLGVSVMLAACEPGSVLRLLGKQRLNETAGETDDRGHAAPDDADGGADAPTVVGAGTDSDEAGADTAESGADADTFAGSTTIDGTASSNTQGEKRTGNFLVKCSFSHRKQADPIVNPGPRGTQSMHLHDFFGNTSTDSDSTYEGMVAADTTCVVSGDTAAYWTPTLLDPDGDPVEPTHMFSYYRNRPAGYSSTVAFPPDFRLIAGGVGEFPEKAWWNCHDDDSETVRYDSPPRCTTSNLNAVVTFPNCWDGVNVDVADHRSHVVHPTGRRCPESHPVKLPDVRYAVHYPKGSGGPGWTLADGTTVPHADFWNTWDQTEFERWLDQCTRVRKCGRVRD